MFPCVPLGVPGFNHKPIGILARGGTEWQGTVGTLMALARLGWMLRVFAGVERREGVKKSPSWREGLSSMRPTHCPVAGPGRCVQGRTDL